MSMQIMPSKLRIREVLRISKGNLVHLTRTKHLSLLLILLYRVLRVSKARIKNLNKHNAKYARKWAILQQDVTFGIINQKIAVHLLTLSPDNLMFLNLICLNYKTQNTSGDSSRNSMEQVITYPQHRFAAYSD